MKPLHFATPPLILTVDDDSTTRQMIRRNLKFEGYEIVEANNGSQCLEMYLQVKPDIILLDAIMPMMDGFECCQKLQHLMQNNFATPVLMITGLDDEESVDHAFAAGATDYVTKPIHWPVLLQRVRRLLQQAQLYKELEEANHKYQRLANEDGLTGVANRRRLDEYLDECWQQAIKDRSALSLLLCDVDFFKKYNDNYGHIAGDFCLQQVAKIMRNCVKRSADLVGRYGGEEFMIILPNTNEAGGLHVGEKIRSSIEQFMIPHKFSSVSNYITLSIGSASVVPSETDLPITLVAAADRALYTAKVSGRNRVSSGNTSEI